MDKNVLKRFAIESRKHLHEKVADRYALYYLDEEFDEVENNELYTLTNEKHNLVLTKEQYEHRQKLLNKKDRYGRDRVIEEAAFTWFNRFICLRYMEIHNFLPLGKNNESLDIRVLSSRDGNKEPEILKRNNLTNNPLDLNIDIDKLEKITDINDKYEKVLLKVCEKMGKVLPQIFDGETDYIELLMPKNQLNVDSFLDKLLKEVPEDNFNDIEVIGWLYQYYNQSEKDRVMKEKRAYKKSEIPYVTQIFTPDWIVKYMVENSLGRLWIENTGDESLESEFKYFIKDNIEIKDAVRASSASPMLPENISFIDPCMGSGHILVYAFEVFMKLYISAGYNKKDIPELILKNNLYGLDIDDRAGQFAIISVMLKAREYDSEIFNKIDFNSLNILSIPESSPELRQYANDIKDKEVCEIVDYLIDTFAYGKEIGSLLIVEEKDYDKVTKYFEQATPNIFNRLLWEGLKDIIRVAKILSKKYDVVVTNPPYMLKKNFTERLREYVEDNYNSQSSDLCTAFMANTLGNKNGYNAIINMQSWMFLQSYEEFRKEIINNYTIFSLLHLGAYAFEDLNGEVVQTVTLIYNTYIKKNVDTLYYRLVESDFKEKEIRFLKKDTSIKYLVNNSKFEKIKGYTFAYWIKDNSYNCLISNKSYGEFVDTKVGLSTGGNDYYLRAWYEIDINDFSKKCDNKKYKEYIYGGKGVEYKKWYGNRIYVINWENDGFEIKNNKKSTIRNEEYYFKETVAFSTIASNTSRWYMDNAIIDVNFRAMFVKDNRVLSLKSILALLNSIIAKYYNKIFSSTLALNVYDIERIPIIDSNKYKQTEMYVNKNIELAKNYWDSFETSWDFKKHPLV